ncbi:MAG: T9SS type A sorting domain-containing protein [Bacteroidota bacterium]|nr:T9SS type A sorting domain-containing protein [Bacteroidota bacterium]
MKKSILLLSTLLLFYCRQTNAQQLLTENFTYTASQALTTNGWGQIGPFGNNPILVSSNGLNYTGYILSSLGNAATIGSSGQDVYKDLATGISSGTVYTSFILRIDTAQLAGDYFLGYLPAGGLNPITGRVYVKLSSAGYYQLGVSKANETAVYSSDSFAIGVTTLAVLKYQFKNGTANDSVSVYNFTSGLPVVEPGAALAATLGGTSPDATSAGRLALRQGTTTSSPSCRIDGIRVGLNWSDLNAVTSNNPPGLTAFFIAQIQSNGARINWTKPPSYNNATQTILVFMKKASAITQGTPTYNPGAYIADANFAGVGSIYQNDSMAKCIFNGDTTTVIVSGLQGNTTYYLMAYIVNNTDSLYSFPSLINGNTPSSAPGTASLFVFTATGTTSANISWNKGLGYNNNRHTQVVFIKASSAIKTGPNTADPAYIFSDANFMGNGSLYQYDSLAKCIYNGDTNRVSISGLSPGTTYYLMLLGVSTSDSLYSAAALVNGMTNSNGPAGVSTLSFSSGSTTTARISWTKPGSYNNINHSTLIYLKELTAIAAGMPPVSNPASITANPDFTGAASIFEYDTSAKCIFKGDTNFVNITGLKPGTLYHFSSYVVNDSDYNYSNPVSGSGTTRFPAIGPASNAAFVPLTVSSARISWVQPTGYVTGSYTTLVFVKPMLPVNIGIPDKAAQRYNASTNIANGTVFQNDNLAHCVLRSDANSVNITGLISGNIYYAVIFIVRDADSTYSPETLVNGYSLGPPPVYSIAQVNHNNTTSGVADSLNVRAALRGIVYGVNLRTSPGIQFFIKDNTGGIMVLNTAKDFGYKVLEGDSIEVQGTITQQRGWTIISTLDTIIHLGSGKTLSLPTTVSVLSEATENNLVEISDLNFFAPLTMWPATSNTTIYVHKTGLTDTIAIRIYATTSLAGTPTPTGVFSVIGMGIQISTSANAPYAFNGYMILPTKKEDIVPFLDTISSFNLIIPLDYMTVKLGGDTTQTLSVVFNKAKVKSGFAPATYRFMLDYEGLGFNNPLFEITLNNGSTDTVAEISYPFLAKLFPAIKPGDSIILSWTIRAVSGVSKRFANQFRTITFKRNIFVGLSAFEKNPDIVISPNPASDAFVIKSVVLPSQVQIMDITGKWIYSYEPAPFYKVDQLPPGIYFIKISFGVQYVIKRIILGY